MKTGKDIRQDFISFFKEKDHRFVRSSPVVPIDDPTLLLTNAGVTIGRPSSGCLSALYAKDDVGFTVDLFALSQ